MRNILIFTIILIIITSCEKINNSKLPDIPHSDSIDIDNDSRIDFVIEYMSIVTTDIPPSYQSITGEIRPLNDNQVLHRQSKGNLFLQVNDTIRKESNTNSNWSDYAASLIGINGNNNKWDDEWSIISDLDSDYILGIKLKDDTEQIGWISLNLNTKSGEISIKDKELTDSAELIIKK
jgi:hypothetical protein